MKIAIFTDTYTPQVNGVVTYLEDSVNVLSKKNQIVIFAPGEGHYRAEKRSPNVTVHWIPSVPFPLYEGYRMSSVNYHRISRLLRKENPDIVHAHAPVILGLEGIIAAKHAHLPIVITYHTHFPDYVFSIMKGKLPSIFGRISAYTVKKMIKHVFKMADIVTAPTQELVAELSSYGLDNVVLMPNGIDFSKFDRKEKAGAISFRKRHNLMKRTVLLYAGRVSFEKKVDTLLEAFSIVEDKFPSSFLVIVGSGPHLHTLKTMAHDLRLKNVAFTGFVDQKILGDAYRSADIFVSASDTETFGLTFIEAMHQGVPAIGVNRLGAKDVIDDGVCGLLAEPGAAASLAIAIERLLGSKSMRTQMGRMAKRKAARFTIDKVARKTVLIYGQAIAKHRRKEKVRRKVARSI